MTDEINCGAFFGAMADFGYEIARLRFGWARIPGIDPQ